MTCPDCGMIEHEYADGCTPSCTCIDRLCCSCGGYIKAGKAWNHVCLGDDEP